MPVCVLNKVLVVSGLCSGKHTLYLAVKNNLAQKGDGEKVSLVVYVTLFVLGDCRVNNILQIKCASNMVKLWQSSLTNMDR